MPITAIDKNSNPFTYKYDVWLAWQFFVIDSVTTHTMLVQVPPHNQFRGSVLCPYPTHHLRHGGAFWLWGAFVGFVLFLFQKSPKVLPYVKLHLNTNEKSNIQDIIHQAMTPKNF